MLLYTRYPEPEYPEGQTLEAISSNTARSVTDAPSRVSVWNEAADG